MKKCILLTCIISLLCIWLFPATITAEEHPEFDLITHQMKTEHCTK